MLKTASGCRQIDKSALACASCIAGYYMAAPGMCCLLGHQALDYHCVSRAGFYQNCAEMDDASGQCLRCSEGFEPSHGSCCPPDRQWSFERQQCEAYARGESCAEIDRQTGFCLQGKPQTYRFLWPFFIGADKILVGGVV